jgi:hypothetical protein
MIGGPVSIGPTLPATPNASCDAKWATFGRARTQDFLTTEAPRNLAVASFTLPQFHENDQSNAALSLRLRASVVKNR